MSTHRFEANKQTKNDVTKQIKVLFVLDDIHLRLSTIFSLLYKFPRINSVSTDRIEVLLDVFMEQDDELVKVVYLLQKLFRKAG